MGLILRHVQRFATMSYNYMQHLKAQYIVLLAERNSVPQIQIYCFARGFKVLHDNLIAFSFRPNGCSL